MSATPVTPVPGNTSAVTTGGSPVQAMVGPVLNGGFVVNPISAADQGVTGDPEPLYVDIVGTCAVCRAGGTIIRLEPGQSFSLIYGQTTSAYVNALTSGHKFTVVQW